MYMYIHMYVCEDIDTHTSIMHKSPGSRLKKSEKLIGTKR